MAAVLPTPSRLQDIAHGLAIGNPGEVQQMAVWILQRLTPRARASDPETSHAAALRAGRKMTRSQEALLAVMAQTGPATDERIQMRYESLAHLGHVPMQSPSGLRTRRSELRAMGRVVKVGSDGPRLLWAVRDVP